MPNTTTNEIYLHHTDGAMHALRNRRLAKLRKEILAGRGGPEVCALVESGYDGYLGADGEIWDFEGLRNFFEGK